MSMTMREGFWWKMLLYKALNLEPLDFLLGTYTMGATAAYRIEISSVIGSFLHGNATLAISTGSPSPVLGGLSAIST